VSELVERFVTPRAGWLSLGLLIVMALALTWAVQTAAWLEQLEFIVPVALWALVAGAILGLVRWTIVVTLPLAAVMGAGLVIWSVGGEYHGALDQAGRAFALRNDAVEWTLTIVQTGYPSQMSPYAIILGLLAWSTAFMAAYAVYRHHRILDAILLLGVAFLTNISATMAPLLGHLLLFVVAALLLWIRGALVDRRDGWQRRRVNEEIEVPAAIMRSGVVFAGASVALAWILTSVAVAAPLTGAWRNLDGVWTGVQDRLEGVFGSLENPQSRLTGSSFGNSFTIFGEWVSSDTEVLVLEGPRPLYLRAAVYDHYNGRGWERSDGPRREVPANELLFTDATPERPTVPNAIRIAEIGIQMRQSVGRTVFTAGSPLRIHDDVLVHETRGEPVIGGIQATSGLGEGDAYTLDVALSRATESELRAAGTNYPESVTRLYLDDSLATDRVAALAREVTEGLDNPYDQAKALARYLTGPSFTYDTVGPETPRNADVVDTFLFAEDGKRGYCQHYASAMALMARSLGLPARVAVGYAPGEQIGRDLYLSRERNAHAWAEIYFPGHGWEIFEATKSIPQVIRSRGDGTTPPTSPQLGVDPLLEIDDWQQYGLEGPGDLPDSVVDEPDEPLPVVAPVDPNEQARAARTGNALLIVGLMLAVGLLVWLRRRALERKWSLLPAGDRAWTRLTSAAGRAGIGPRPAETIYEYAGWLEEQLPRHGEPIRVVADGKVWQTYSGRQMTAPAGARLEAAWRALQRPLLWLAIRRGMRRAAGRRDD
jgi:transglutaminase-like putative cysteine protease